MERMESTQITFSTPALVKARQAIDADHKLLAISSAGAVVGLGVYLRQRNWKSAVVFLVPIFSRFGIAWINNGHNRELLSTHLPLAKRQFSDNDKALSAIEQFMESPVSRKIIHNDNLCKLANSLNTFLTLVNDPTKRDLTWMIKNYFAEWANAAESVLASYLRGERPDRVKLAAFEYHAYRIEQRCNYTEDKSKEKNS